MRGGFGRRMPRLGGRALPHAPRDCFALELSLLAMFFVGRGPHLGEQVGWDQTSVGLSDSMLSQVASGAEGQGPTWQHRLLSNPLLDITEAPRQATSC